MKQRLLTKHAEKRFGEFVYEATDLLRINLSIALLPKKGKILDIGCGDGQIGKLIQKQSPRSVFGVDVSTKSLKIAKKNGLRVKRADAEGKLPFPSNFFDGVYASEVIEHLFNPGNLLAESYRVLKPNGTLVLTTPNFMGLGSRMAVLSGNTPWMMNNWLTPKNDGHIRYFSPGKMKLKLKEYKFTDIRLISDTVRLMPILDSQLLAKLFPNFGLHVIVSAKKQVLYHRFSK